MHEHVRPNLRAFVGFPLTATELIAHVADATGMSKAQVRTVLSTTADVVGNVIARHESVKINGLGIFKAKHRKARVGKNPQTGKPLKIPAKWTAACTVSKTLKDRA